MKQYQLGLYEKAVPADLDWDRRLEAAKLAGFDAMELSVDETDERLARLDWSAAERRALRDKAREAGLPFSSICLSAHRKYPLGSADPATERRGLEIMQKALELATEPAPGDQVVEASTVPVFVDASVAEELDDKVLDAEMHGDQVGFSLIQG